MDDLIIDSNSWNSHLQHLELTLKTLQDVNIACNPRKTEISFPEIDYLGFRVSRNSMRLSEKRIEIISKITALKNVKALQRMNKLLTNDKLLAKLYSISLQEYSKYAEITAERHSL